MKRLTIINISYKCPDTMSETDEDERLVAVMRNEEGEKEDLNAVLNSVDEGKSGVVRELMRLANPETGDMEAITDETGEDPLEAVESALAAHRGVLDGEEGENVTVVSGGPTITENSVLTPDELMDYLDSNPKGELSASQISGLPQSMDSRHKARVVAAVVRHRSENTPADTGKAYIFPGKSKVTAPVIEDAINEVLGSTDHIMSRYPTLVLDELCVADEVRTTEKIKDEWVPMVVYNWCDEPSIREKAPKLARHSTSLEALQKALKWASVADEELGEELSGVIMDRDDHNYDYLTLWGLDREGLEPGVWDDEGDGADGRRAAGD